MDGRDDGPVLKDVGGRTYLETRGLRCAECERPLSLRKDERGVRYLHDGSCVRSPCAGSVGAHPDGSPLGWPADVVTKRARSEAHEVFDRIWRTGIMSRTGAYSWMADRMSMTKEQAHVGKFGRDDCVRLIEAVRLEFPHLFLDVDPV